jgi:uncharacterized protein (TIGR03086 family)
MEATVDDPVDLFDRAAARAHDVMAAVTGDQLALATPCREWSVQDLIDHMTGGPDYLLAALAGRVPEPRSGSGAADYRKALDEVLTGLGEPGAGERTCMSPLGFEWTVRDAVAGTFMDTLIHTWDLAVATGQDRTLDPALVDACVAMFLPEMPERGRAGGLVGPAVPVPEDASPQERLLAAMGRQP